MLGISAVVAAVTLQILKLVIPIALSKLEKVGWKIHERWSIDLIDRSASFDLVE